MTEARIQMRNANGEISKEFKIDMDQDYGSRYSAQVEGLWTHGLHWKERSTGQQIGISFCSEEQTQMLYHSIRSVQREDKEEMGFGLFD